MKNVLNTFWNDATFINLTYSSKLLLLFLYTDEATPIEGCIQLNIKLFAAKTGLDENLIFFSLKELNEKAYIELYDNYIFLPDFPKLYWTTSPKLTQKLREKIAQIEAQPLQNTLYTSLEQLNKDKQAEKIKNMAAKCIDEWQKNYCTNVTFAAYPHINIIEELLRIQEWLIAHPEQIKPAKDMTKFFQKWLATNEKEAAAKAKALEAPKPKRKNKKTQLENEHNYDIAVLEKALFGKDE